MNSDLVQQPIKKIKHQTKLIIHKCFNIFGFDIHRYGAQSTSMYDIRRRRIQIFKNNKISIVLDVGANTGNYAKQLKQYGYKGKIISFEPLSAAFFELKKAAEKDSANWECYNIALGDQDGESVINIAGNSESSSLLPMLDAHVSAAPYSKYIGTEKIKVQKLDTLFSSLILEKKENLCLKIDVQGYEKQVLQGTLETLSFVKVIEMELSLVPLYGDQVLFRFMVDYLISLGFELVSLEPLFIDPSTGHVLQFDGIFVKS